jgi:hypothetical protein
MKFNLNKFKKTLEENMSGTCDRPNAEQRPQKRQRTEPQNAIYATEPTQNLHQVLPLPRIAEDIIRVYSSPSDFHSGKSSYTDVCGLIFYHDQHKLIATIPHESIKTEILFCDNRVTSTECSNVSCNKDVLWCQHICATLFALCKTPGKILDFGNLCRTIYTHSKEDLASAMIELLTNHSELAENLIRDLRGYQQGNKQHIEPPTEQTDSIASIQDITTLIDTLPAASVVPTHSINTSSIQTELQNALAEYLQGSVSVGECYCYDSDDSEQYYHNDEDCNCKVPKRQFNFSRVKKLVNSHLDMVEKLINAKDNYNALNILEQTGTVLNATDVTDVNRDLYEEDYDEEVVTNFDSSSVKKEHRELISRMDDLLFKIMLSADEQQRNRWVNVLDSWSAAQIALENEDSFQSAFDAARVGWESERLQAILSGDTEATNGFTESRKMITTRLTKLLDDNQLEKAYNYARAVKRDHLAGILLIRMGKIEQAFELTLTTFKKCSSAAVILETAIMYLVDPQNQTLDTLSKDFVDRYEFSETEKENNGDTAFARRSAEAIEVTMKRVSNTDTQTSNLIVNFIMDECLRCCEKINSASLTSDQQKMLFKFGMKSVETFAGSEQTRVPGDDNYSRGWFTQNASTRSPIVYILLALAQKLIDQNIDIYDDLAKIGSEFVSNKDRQISVMKMLEPKRPELALKIGASLLKSSMDAKLLETILSAAIATRSEQLLDEILATVRSSNPKAEIIDALHVTGETLIIRKDFARCTQLLMIILQGVLLISIDKDKFVTFAILEKVFKFALNIDKASNERMNVLLVASGIAKIFVQDHKFIAKYKWASEYMQTDLLKSLLHQWASTWLRQKQDQSPAVLCQVAEYLRVRGYPEAALLLVETAFLLHASKPVPSDETAISSTVFAQIAKGMHCNCQFCKEVRSFLTKSFEEEFLVTNWPDSVRNHVRNLLQNQQGLSISEAPHIGPQRRFTIKKKGFTSDSPGEIQKRQAMIANLYQKIVMQLFVTAKQVDEKDTPHESYVQMLVHDLGAVGNVNITKALLDYLLQRNGDKEMATQALGLGKQTLKILQEKKKLDVGSIQTMAVQMAKVAKHLNDVQSLIDYMCIIFKYKPTQVSTHHS